MITRLYEVLCALLAGGAIFFASNAIWAEPGERIKDVPKNVRENPASYRAHYRGYYGRIGGK